eukprot:COSAG01_NODE_2845_length_6987_cov_19.830139_3_plen_76_part_00
MLERLPYRVMALHGSVIVGGDILYIQMTFNSAPLASHDTMWERTIGPNVFLITPRPSQSNVPDYGGNSTFRLYHL